VTHEEVVRLAAHVHQLQLAKAMFGDAPSGPAFSTPGHQELHAHLEAAHASATDPAVRSALASALSVSHQAIGRADAGRQRMWALWERHSRRGVLR
jgi:hypothetical protein